MRAINLLPRHHRERLQYARLVRRWVLGSAFYAGGLVLLAAVVHGVYSVDEQALPAEIAHLRGQTAQVEKGRQATLLQLAKVEADVDLRTLVNTPPDFAVLLSAVSGSCEEDAVLTSLKLDITSIAPLGQAAAPAAKSGKTLFDPLSGPSQVKVQMTGLARTQPGVGLVVQRLQGTGLFDDVRLIKTSREGFLTGPALAFQLSCDLEAGPPTESGDAR